jgi:hypothetical protein
LVPGKHLWDSITISLKHRKDELPTTYFDRVELGLYDGCGNLIESWSLTEVQFRELQTQDYLGDDYSDSELRFDYRKVVYKPAKDWMDIFGNQGTQLRQGNDVQITDITPADKRGVDCVG